MEVIQALSMAEEEHRRSERREQDLSKEKAKFGDFVRIHAIEGKVITRKDEKKILEQGITRFELEFQEAQGIFLSVAAERDIALISRVEHHIGTYLEHVVKRRKVSRRDFEDAVAMYRKLSHGSMPDSEIRERVKQMTLDRSWTGKRRRWLLGTKKWFKRI